MFPFRTAIKLPVFFYGKVRFGGLNGQVIINAPLKKGLVKFGLNIEIAKRTLGTSELTIDGIFTINGSFCTGVDYCLFIQKGGVFEIGDNSHLASRTRIFVTNKVVLGRYFRLSNDSEIFDSSFHYLIDTALNEVKRMNGSIIIDDYCWIGSRTMILKNTRTPKYTTVASNSLLNKDYANVIPEKSLIGGIPGKLIRTNIVRVFDHEKEIIIQDFFDANPNEMVFKVQNPFDLIKS